VVPPSPAKKAQENSPSNSPPGNIGSALGTDATIAKSGKVKHQPTISKDKYDVMAKPFVSYFNQKPDDRYASNYKTIEDLIGHKGTHTLRKHINLKKVSKKIGHEGNIAILSDISKKDVNNPQGLPIDEICRQQAEACSQESGSQSLSPVSSDPENQPGNDEMMVDIKGIGETAASETSRAQPHSLAASVSENQPGNDKMMVDNEEAGADETVTPETTRAQPHLLAESVPECQSGDDEMMVVDNVEAGIGETAAPVTSRAQSLLPEPSVPENQPGDDKMTVENEVAETSSSQPLAKSYMDKMTGDSGPMSLPLPPTMPEVRTYAMPTHEKLFAEPFKRAFTKKINHEKVSAWEKNIDNSRLQKISAYSITDPQKGDVYIF